MSQGFFSRTYPEARKKFHEQAGKAQARIKSWELPFARGTAGEALAMDVAWLGSDTPRGAVIVTSGTHGVEGYAGSGFQCAFLARRAATVLRQGVAIILVHAINPFGFSHVRRVNEHNIDLNRNFIDWSQPAPENPEYAELAPLLTPTSWTAEEQDRTLLGLMGKLEELGIDRLQAIISGGQYDHPTGLFHGGTGPTWSHRWLRECVRDSCVDVR